MTVGGYGGPAWGSSKATPSPRPYSRRMLSRGLRVASRLLLLGLVVWAVRLLSHSKLPEPEGHWREVSESELAGQ